jgi:hypothetical protein
MESFWKEKTALWSKILEIEARNFCLEKQLKKAKNQKSNNMEREKIAFIEKLKRRKTWSAEQSDLFLMFGYVVSPDIIQMTLSD